MKLFFIAFTFFLIEINLKAEITDQSFTDQDRYVLLTSKDVGNTDSLNLDIKFIPPKGKKVNRASFVKMWEKEKNIWNLTETVEISGADEEFAGNILTHNAILKSKKSEIALEIDFIHCNYSGGQCDQERYLSKIPRNTLSKNSKLNYELKIEQKNVKK